MCKQMNSIKYHRNIWWIELLMLDWNTWNHLTVCKQIISGSFKNCYRQTFRLQIIYIYIYKAIFPSCDCVNSTVWMHHMDADKGYREKARRELHKNVTSHIDQILEAIYHETEAVRPPTSYFCSHPSEMNKACRTMLEKQGRTHKWRSPMEPCTRTCQC